MVIVAVRLRNFAGIFMEIREVESFTGNIIVYQPLSSTNMSHFDK